MLETCDTALRAAMAERGITPPMATKNNGRADIQTPAHKTANDTRNATAACPVDKALIGRKGPLVGRGSKACSREV